MSYCRVIYFCLQKYLDSDAVEYKAAVRADGSDILNKVGMIQQINLLSKVVLVNPTLCLPAINQSQSDIASMVLPK